MLRVIRNDFGTTQAIPLTQVNIRSERHGPHILHLTPETDAREILEVLDQDGRILKKSRKRLVRHVGPYVLKSRRDAPFLGTLRHTFLGDTYRRGWHVALRLHEAGAGVPTPRALLEKRWHGLITGNVLVSDYVPNLKSLGDYGFALVSGQAPQQEIEAFLDALRDAYKQVLNAGVYLKDLSRTNILTKDGRNFYFVDLDDAELDVAYTRKRRMRNHLHLYRQLRLFWPRTTIASFIQGLLPENEPLEPWVDILENEYVPWRDRLARKNNR